MSQVDRAALADFLRTRRAALQPEDVGLPRGWRSRRTGGLRREEVAALSSMSADYYSRIEQRRGPHPSRQMLTALARALRLSPDERDHLFRLAGHAPPRRIPAGDEIAPGMLRIFERLADTPAQVMNHLGETLVQNRLAVALTGDDSRHTGMARSLAYRWFTDPASRLIHPEADHARHSRTIAAQLRAAATREPDDPRTGALVDALLTASPEFAAVWRDHPIAGLTCPPKRIHHPRLGPLHLHGQSLLDPDHPQTLLVFTAPPGTESEAKLHHLASLATEPA
ncbi:helix-turn-helix transcriptional regulator [Streptomyces sp. GMY02]|uniref:helix-turn-helix transcriptional regulator n=1 Tax=Streptomyces sp. GMY02 TaxID=1333528 RepID=UPI0020B7CFF0|nr:helix-turn-helix transcriptional regulator [Streptomyces sp. GMY02]